MLGSRGSPHKALKGEEGARGTDVLTALGNNSPFLIQKLFCFQNINIDAKNLLKTTSKGYKIYPKLSFSKEGCAHPKWCARQHIGMLEENITHSHVSNLTN